MTDTADRTTDRPLRVDAARNRERVLAAAVELFAQQGLDVPIPDIAARAGVGKATVYRSFPTREHLVGAIVLERLHWFRDRADEALEAPSAWEALAELLFSAAEAQTHDQSVVSSFAITIDLPEVEAGRQETSAALSRLFVRAQEQGSMRPGVTSADLRVLFSGSCQMLVQMGEHDPVRWRRYVSLILDALRADGVPARALPEPR